MKEFAQMAQDFVEATSMLVGHRTINIMDQNAVIIASTEKERIGTFHQGAAEVLQTGKPVLVLRENLKKYPGAKEGYNMPIFLHDEIIGVVGIFGCEKEVRDIANLLRVYVSQHFAQYQMIQRQKMETEVRTQLLRSLILGDEKQMENVTQMCDVLNLQLKFPLRLILAYTDTRETSKGYVEELSFKIQNLIWKGILDRQKDVFGLQKQGYVILLGDCGRDSTGKNRLKRLLMEIQKEWKWKAAVGGICRNIAEIPEGMKDVSILKNMRGGEIQDLEDHMCRTQYLLGRSMAYGGDIVVRDMKERLLEQEGEKQAEQLLLTAKCYYEENGSVVKASEKLHLHKNTLLYRMKRLYQIFDMEQDTAFVREFYIRMLLQYCLLNKI